jgi:hypothetical protein
MRRFAALLLGAFVHTACATAHDPNGPPLQLHRGGWGPQFTHNGPAKQSVFNWASLDTAFVAVIAPDAAALEEARRATPLRTAALVSYVGMTVFTTKMLITAFDATADGVTQGDVDSVNSDYIFVLGFGIGATVFEQLGQRHLRRAVSMYNVGATRAVGSREGLASLLRQSVFNLSLAPTFKPDHGVGLVARTGFHVR